MSEAQWRVDAPGQWMLDRSHAPAGCTPIVQYLMLQSMPFGMRTMFAALGAPVETLDLRFINGFMYTRLRPLIAPDRPSKRLPPLPIVKLGIRLHPEMRRRNRSAEQALATEPWVQVIADWHATGKASIEDQNLQLQDIDMARLSDVELVRHTQRCLDHAITQWRHHFWLHGFDLGPLGRFLFEAKQWGIDADAALSLLEGASPSTSAPLAQLVQMRAAIDASGEDPHTIQELRSISSDLAEQFDRYMRRRQAVLFSRYDVDGRTLGECPELILASIRNATLGQSGNQVEQRTVAVRSQVPADDRARFDHLLLHARSAMDLRDDNGPTTAEWPLGLLRLSLLALGDRLVGAGLLNDANLVLEMQPDEILPTLFDSPSLQDQFAQRLDIRERQRHLDPPSMLGAVEIEPPLEVLPEALGQLVSMVRTVMEHMGMDGKPAATGMHGSGVGTTVFRGVARVAASPEDAFDLLNPGDILVVRCTTPAYNLVLSLAGGVVTSEGGPMSHAAVLARELGIPAVIGVRDAFTAIPDGAMIEVDPVAGCVRILSAAVPG